MSNSFKEKGKFIFFVRVKIQGDACDMINRVRERHKGEDIRISKKNSVMEHVTRIGCIAGGCLHFSPIE